MRARHRVPARLAIVLSLVALAVAVAALAAAVDAEELRAGIGEGIRDPLGLALIVAALLAAFSMRARAWCHLLPSVGFGQSLAAVHVALGANHVLPFRLGEPLRVVSLVRRTGVDLATATSTTVLLRSADIVALAVLGAVAGPGLFAHQLGGWGAAALTFVAAVGLAAVGVVVRQRRRTLVRLPGPATVALVVGAWLAEAVVVWRVAGWFDIGLGPREAVVVLAAAVSVQLLAVTPGGVGTYEAAATAALVATGAPVGVAVAAAIAVHAVKTIYSLGAGAVGLIGPQPSMLGRLRLGPTPAPVPTHRAAPGRPVVLFFPARNEAPRVAAVIGRAPAVVAGHPVQVVVVDDGSTDATAEIARAAGATVVSHDVNRGLGAAVRTGFAHATAVGAAAVAFCDADGEYDPAELAQLVTPVLAGDAHYVVGSRFGGTIQRMLPHRRFGNVVLTRWVRLITRQPVTDGQSGYRALSAAAAASAELAHDYNYAQVLTIDLVGKGFGYHEVPITYAFRSTGRSFVRLGTYLRHVVPTVWRQLNPPRPDGRSAPTRSPHHEPAVR